ncbi:hypothetical protein CO151_02705 [bacterium CG_4_9_14_3_um_filter_65_15]|nr:MAG: hypothetical protein CO151_02705 [bacterium CG_4_9_14_3_um_filter_65_15]
MYLDHFGLAVNPFGLSPKLEFLYKSEAFEESMAHLIYGVDNSEAIVMITGAIGTGKTMALQSFMANLNQGFQWALVTNTQVTPAELLKLILEDLGVEFPFGCDKSDLLILFKEFLVKTSRNGRRVIIIIDEAQNMTREVLEEVRLLTNLGQGDIQPVQVILVGQPELEPVVNRPDLAQLRQRIRVHYRLDPLSRKEVEEYLNHRMAVAGCKDHVFTSGAIDRLANYSGGVPRLVNSLAGQALLSAFVAGRKQVTARDVEPPEGVSTVALPSSTHVLEPDPPPAVAGQPSPDEPRDRVHAVKRKRKNKRSAPLILTLVVVLLVMVVLSLYLRGDLQKYLDRFLPAGDSLSPAAVEQVDAPDSLLNVVTGDSASYTGEEMQPDQEDSLVVPEAVPEQSAPAADRYFVQVASFRTMQRAERCCRELHDQGFETLIKSQYLTDTLWQRVLIGPYPDLQAAKDGLSRFKHPPEEDYFPISLIEPDSGS